MTLKLGIKINPKQNALSGFKLLSRDSGSPISFEIHMTMFPQAPSRLVNANSILKQVIFPEFHMGDYHYYNAKWQNLDI